MRAAVLLLLATGCRNLIRIEEAVPAPLSYTEAGTGAIVAGPGFALQFADGEGFHFPDALMIDGVDVMGHDPATGCFREDETGLLIAPTPRISAHGPAEPVTSRLVQVLRGPAVVQAKVEWMTRFDCNATRKPGGTSTFTVFPDGRIVRHDALADSGSAVISPVPCACEIDIPDSQDRLFNINTYWTLARTDLRGIYFTPGQAPDPLPTAAGGAFGNQDVSCIDGGAYQVAFAWRNFIDTTIRGTDALIVLDRRMRYGIPELVGLTDTNSSAVFIGRGDSSCTAALARAEEYSSPSPLKINEVPTMPADRDGIYGGDGGDGEPGIKPKDDRAVLEGPVTSSFAVWLRFSRPVDALRTELEGAEGPWYLPQRVDDRSWIVWFPKPLAEGKKITIEPI